MLENYKFLDPFGSHIYSYELNNSAKIEQENYLFTIKIIDNQDQVSDAGCEFAMKTGWSVFLKYKYNLNLLSNIWQFS